MSSADPEPVVPDPSVTSPRAPRAVVMGATVLLSGFALFQAPALWSEWQGLRRDWERDRLSRPMGFIDIAPNISYARPPVPWSREEGNELLLWSGWHDGSHLWFHVGRGEIDAEGLLGPMGRDVIRAIDRTILESRHGAHWDIMAPEAWVVGLELGGEQRAYPELLMEKVEVVNDTLGAQPVLVVHTPFQPLERSADVFDPMLDGSRLTFGLSGYLQQADRRPLLYDRETESLWTTGDHTLTCLGGRHKGAQLRSLERIVPSPWSDWSYRHPGARLVVGADRSSAQKPAQPVEKATRSPASPSPSA